MTIPLAPIYMSAITFVGTFLFVLVDRLEPNPRLAFIFKCALLGAGGAAIMTQLFRSAGVWVFGTFLPVPAPLLDLVEVARVGGR